MCLGLSEDPIGCLIILSECVQKINVSECLCFPDISHIYWCALTAPFCDTFLHSHFFCFVFYFAFLFCFSMFSALFNSFMVSGDISCSETLHKEEFQEKKS